jgi:SnoaL-like protein
MTKTEFRDLLASLADAWSRRDYAAAAAAFAEDVRYGDPTRYSFSGRAELRAFFEADEGYDQRTVWHTIVFDEEQQAGAAEYTYEGTHRYHGTALVKIAGGKISRWREYQHVDPREWETFTSATAF